MLVEVASHFKGGAPLVAATQVCHLWRTTLISSPRLWSHLDFADKERVLVYSERSKSAPVRVDITNVDYPFEVVRESLKKIATRVNTLWAARGSFLNELLAHPMPLLEDLEIIDSDGSSLKKLTHLPSLTSLVISGFDLLRFRAPILTSFHLTDNPTNDSPGLEARHLLNFLQSCPLLEVASISCCILDTNPNSDEVVSLPLLHSFTHKSPFDIYQLCLIDRLSLPSSCRVTLVIDVTEHKFSPWIPGLPTPSNSSYLSDIRTVKIPAHPRNKCGTEDHATFKIELIDSNHRTTSFDRISYRGNHPSEFSHRGFLDAFRSI